MMQIESARESPTLVIANSADLASSWLRMPRRLLPYWSAVHWFPPLSVTRAQAWFDENSTDCLMLIRTPEVVGYAVVTPDQGGAVRRYHRILIGFEDDRSWMDHGRAVLSQLTSFVLTDLNGLKCEWWILSDWQSHRGAAEALGYRLEAAYPDACSTGGRHQALELWGLLKEEWIEDGDERRG